MKIFKILNNNVAVVLAKRAKKRLLWGRGSVLRRKQEKISALIWWIRHFLCLPGM